ncbi:MAG: protein jag [Selenomonadaceae bacterium]|nr:protein jag [Selenomonadaceae bacterium]
MAKTIEKTGKTINEAIQAAVDELGVAERDLIVEVLETPTKKFFGLLGETPAKIRATVKESEPISENVNEEVSEPVNEIISEVVTETIEQTASKTVNEITEEPLDKSITETPVSETPVEELAEKFEPILSPSPVVEETTAVETFDRNAVVESAQKYLQDVFAAMNLEVEITVKDEGEEGYLFDLSGKSLGVLIGRRGQALDALQYLLNLSVNRSSENKVHFTLDIEDYRRRREETLTKLANSVAERAIKTRRDVRLEPMNRHERKIIHTVLQGNDRVETYSSGEEPYRYVIVTPKKGKH